MVPPSEEVRFVVSYLAGDALRWFITKYPGDERSKGWSALKSDLKAAFRSEDGQRRPPRPGEGCLHVASGGLR